MTWKASVKLDESETPYALSIAEVGSALRYDYLRPQTYAGATAPKIDQRQETLRAFTPEQVS